MPLANVKAEDEDRVSVEPSAVAGISAFLGKLWKMVEDSKTDHLISWGASGNTFVIKNQIDFAKSILPNYYKHNNIASFIRQLNMYGFHKIISTTSGALDSSDNDEIEFTHPSFVRGHPYLLEQIKRKMNNPKENLVKSDNSNQFNESFKRVFNDIKNLRGKQEHLGSQLGAVKQENEILWRELSLLRQKHAAQQNVLNKLIRFLVSLAQPSSNHGLVKRRLVPLMLKDSASSGAKSTLSSYYEEGDHVYTVKKREASSCGPTIHEIHTDLADNMPVLEENSPIMIDNEIVTSPASSIANSDISVTSPEPVPAALLLPSKKGIQTMYVTPNQQLKSHYLISSGRSKNDESHEYLVPDKTDNPLLELVHETDTDNGGEYITIVRGDGTNINEGGAASSIGENDFETAIGSKVVNKRRMIPRRQVKKETTLAAPKMTTARKVERRKKPGASKEEAILDTNEFLFDMGLESEPIIKIEEPSNRTGGIRTTMDPSQTPTSDKSMKNTSRIPITVDDLINVAPVVSNPKSLDAPLGSNVPAKTMPTLSIPAIDDTAHSPLQNSSIVFNVPSNTNPFVQSSTSPASNINEVDKNSSDNLMKEINECMDNAENMEIACPGSTAKSYVDDISIQLNDVQSGIDSGIDTLKELMQNSEGFTLDTNAFFDMLNQEPLNYGIPQDIPVNFHRPEEGKIEGHELISSQPVFDLDDIFGQEDWTQSTTPIRATDTDYCNLNTPQVEKSTDETQSLFPTPSKKIRS